MVSKEGLYSFTLPSGWERELIEENVMIAYPSGSDGYRFRISYMDFPDKPKISDIPRIFSESANFVLKESGEFFGASLWAFGAQEGVYIKGYFITPEGPVQVQEIYFIAGPRGYGLYSLIFPGEDESQLAGTGSILSSFKIDPSVYQLVVASSDNGNNGEEDTQGVEYTVPEDGVNMALIYNGAKVLGARDEFGSADSMIDGESGGYTEFYGYTYAFLNEPLTVVLDKVYLLNKIDILFYNLDSSYYQFTVETSLDNENWEMLEDRSFGEWYNWQYISFPERPIKYIRINCKFNSAYTGNYKIIEISAYLIKTE